MSQTKLLLIDDERPLLMNVKEILELEGFEVVTGGNGFEGLAQFEKEKPDLIVCDIMMPDMDGYGFIQRLRERGYTDVPFIFLTAKSDYDDIRTGMTIGADDYLIKPVKGKQLVEAIRTRLQRKREINKRLEKDLAQIENGFKLVTDQEFFASAYDIINYLHMLKAKYTEMSGDKVQEYLGYMEKSTGRLIKLLTKVKTWQEQKKNLEAQAHNPVATAVLEVLKKSAKAAAISYQREADLLLNVTEDAYVAASPELLETLFGELLDNAFKFSDKGNPVVIGSMKDNQQYVIMVADCGKSTTAESLNNIKPFEKRGDGQNDPGVGLGLAITQLIVKSIGA
ncbi:MAG: hybrid sensor histidine kinase/response regulator, partial [Chitinophagaceae bacterium]